MLVDVSASCISSLREVAPCLMASAEDVTATVWFSAFFLSPAFPRWPSEYSGGVLGGIIPWTVLIWPQPQLLSKAESRKKTGLMCACRALALTLPPCV